MTEQLALGETEAERKAGLGRKGLDTDEVRRRLAKRHEWPEWLFFEEVPFDDEEKNRMRLADCIALPTYQSRGYVVHGFEIKVTRTDWLRELKDGAKAEAIAKDVDRFWLVLGDAAIATDEEVPPAWGIMVPNGDSLRVRRQAKAMREDGAPMDRRFLVTLARKAQKMANDRSDKARIEAFDHGFETGKKSAAHDHGQAPAKAAAYDVLVEALGHHRSYGVLTDFHVEEIRKAYEAGRAVLSGSWHGLDSLPDTLERHAKDLQEALKRSAADLREALKRNPPSNREEGALPIRP